jgi:hypothetical protein
MPCEPIRLVNSLHFAGRTASRQWQTGQENVQEHPPWLPFCRETRNQPISPLKKFTVRTPLTYKNICSIVASRGSPGRCATGAVEQPVRAGYPSSPLGAIQDPIISSSPPTNRQSLDASRQSTNAGDRRLTPRPVRSVDSAASVASKGLSRFASRNYLEVRPPRQNCPLP